MTRSTVLVVGEKYQPHSLAFSVFAVAAGILHFTLSQGPTVLDVLWPGWAVAGWYVMLGAGGVFGLLGVAWPSIVWGWLLERAGQVGVAAPTAVFSMMAFYAGGWNAVVGGGLIACWSAASVWRVWQINRSLKRITRDAL